jgi:polyphosphate kinase
MVNTLLRGAHECLKRQILPALRKVGIHVVDHAHLNSRQRSVVNKYFADTVFPTLTPLAFDPGRPFPHISNLSLNLAVLLRDREGTEHFARVKIPNSIPQLVAVSSIPSGDEGKHTVRQYFVWLEQLVAANLEMLFPGMKILEAHPFHITRDAETAIQELEAGDLLESVEEGVWQRRFADVVRLEVNDAMPPAILDILIKNLEVSRDDIYQLSGPVGLSRLRNLWAVDRPELKDPPFVPATPSALESGEEREDIIRRHSSRGHSSASSLRFVPASSFISAASGA